MHCSSSLQATKQWQASLGGRCACLEPCAIYFGILPGLANPPGAAESGAARAARAALHQVPTELGVAGYKARRQGAQPAPCASSAALGQGIIRCVALRSQVAPDPPGGCQSHSSGNSPHCPATQCKGNVELNFTRVGCPVQGRPLAHWPPPSEQRAGGCRRQRPPARSSPTACGSGAPRGSAPSRPQRCCAPAAQGSRMWTSCKTPHAEGGEARARGLGKPAALPAHPTTPAER